MNYIKGKIGEGLHIPQMVEKVRQIGNDQLVYVQRKFPYLNQTLPPRRMTDTQRKNLVKKIERISKMLDNAIPYSPIPIGIDSLLGFIPIIGSTIGGFLSLYQIYLSTTLGIPLWLLAHMMMNIIVAFVLSLIPLLGGIIRMFYKSNVYNYEELSKWLNNPTPEYTERLKQGERRPSAAGSPPGEISWTKLSSDVTNLASKKTK